MSGRGVVQELCLITLNRPDLEYKLAKVGYLCPSGHEAHYIHTYILVGRNFNGACVRDLCTMTPTTKFKDCRFNWFCSMSKISRGGSQMRNFTTFLRT